MLGFLLVNVYALLLIIATTIIFFSKNRLKQIEDETYKKFLIVNVFICVSGIVLGLVVDPSVVFSKEIIIFFNKIYLICLILWIFILTFYTLYISIRKKEKIHLYKKIFDVLIVISILLVVLLPIDVNISTEGAVSDGLAIVFTYLVFSVGFLVQIIALIINHKDFKNKKYIPLYLLIIFGIIVVISLIINPALNYIINPAFIFIAFIMFHTIENPDKKILEEIHNAKLISDNANEEKSMFLYNISNEIKQIISDISISNNNILEEVDKKKPNLSLIDNSASEINSFITKFDTMINEVYDISQVDVNNIKIYKDKYNIKIIIKELVQKYSKKAQSKSLDFRSKIASDVPDYLYGDSVTLKKVINIILDNSYKNTTSGYIEFNVDTIFKNNICRLVISIEDSGIGMRAGELNYALNKESDVKDSELADTLFNAKKMITLMGGTLIVNSIYGKGTKIKIVLDQKVEKIDSKLDKYVQIYDKKKLLLVDDSDASCKIISKMLDDTNVVLDIVKSGKEALDKIRSKEKYDLILLDEDMHPLNGIEVMNKFMEIKNFNIDVVLLTRNNNYEYNEDYLKYGFSNYLLKPIDKEKLFEVISKK